MSPREVVGDATRNDSWAAVRLVVEGERIAAADAPGLDRPLVDLTLIEAEALEGLVLPGNGVLEFADARRNIVTRGIELDALVGRRFRIGNVECVGQRPCEPCAHLERLTVPGVLRGLIHRGGLRADVLADGHIMTGSAITTID